MLTAVLKPDKNNQTQPVLPNPSVTQALISVGASFYLPFLERLILLRADPLIIF